MRKIREVLRLKYEQNLTHRQIACSLKISAGTVSRYINAANKEELTWPLPVGLTEEVLEQRLFKQAATQERKPVDFQYIHQELKRKGVTLSLLWREYREQDPKGYEYSQFCAHYKAFRNQLAPSLRMTHVAGDKLFVDYSGLTMDWVDERTGEVNQAEIFVAVLGASNYTFVLACKSQELSEWLHAHVKALEFFGGVPNCIVPDNLKSGVSKAHVYDPDINPSYQDLAVHYQVAIVPTRARAPKDKAKVEVGVQGIQRWILAPLRQQTFFSISEINQAIAPLLAAYNERPFQELPGCRASQFREIEQAKLNPLPKQAYEFASWKLVRAGIDYHIVYDNHRYSVPYQYVKKQLQCRITKNHIECFHQGERIAHHQRQFTKGTFSTITEHMPISHQEQVKWTPERIEQWARDVGKQTLELIKHIIHSRPIAQQAFRACVGVLRLREKYGGDALEAAAGIANQHQLVRYKDVVTVIENLGKFDEQETSGLPAHQNIRGKNYFN